MVVDDSSTVISMFEHSIEPLNANLSTFRSAADSLAFLQANQPDLIFMDIMMPEKDGLTFLKELRDDPMHRDTKVVMVSSKDYAQDRMAAKELDVLEFVAKPMGTQTIRDLVIKYTNASLKVQDQSVNE